MRIAGSGTNAIESERTAKTAFDDETFSAIWASSIDPDGEMAGLEFESEAAVFLFGGQRNTGGYYLDVRGVKVEGDTLVVDAVVKGPGEGAMAAQVITQPWAVIAVKSRAFKNVRWER